MTNLNSTNWICSDHHFGHEAPYNKFLLPNGSFLRADLASNAKGGDLEMVRRHNAIVSQTDRVYFLGDVCFHKRHLATVASMHGRKVLIKGNHDLLDLKDYAAIFEDIRSIHQFKGTIMSHIPIHTGSLSRWGLNIHGHLHANRVLLATGDVDARYYNACVELNSYSPINLNHILNRKGS